MQLSIDNNRNTLTFGAIHPTTYYIKHSDGKFYRVTSNDTIESLQLYIVKMLNKNHNDSRRTLFSTPPTKESPSKKALRTRLVKFFVNRDDDYKKCDISAGFNQKGKQECYLLTGDSVEITKQAAAPIEVFHHNLKIQAKQMATALGIKFEDAKKQLSEKHKFSLNSLKSKYFETVNDEIQKNLSQYNPKNSPFDAFFVEHKIGGKKVYELVDAKINGR